VSSTTAHNSRDIPVVKQFVNRLLNCLLHSTVSHSVSTCAHFMIHH